MESRPSGKRHWHAGRGWLRLNQEIAKTEIETSKKDSRAGADGLRDRRRPFAGAISGLSNAPAETNRTGKPGEFDRRGPRPQLVIAQDQKPDRQGGLSTASGPS